MVSGKRVKVAPDALRVLLVSRRYYPEVIGGGQISAHHIAIALRKAGVDVRVLTFVTEGARKDEVIDTVPITRLPIRTLTFFPRLSNLEWMYREMALKTELFLKEFRPDIMHALNGESVPSIARVSNKINIPFVAHVNGPWLFCFPGDGTNSKGSSCWGCSGLKRLRETLRVRNARSIGAKAQTFLFWLYSIPHMEYLWRSAQKASVLIPISNGVGDELTHLGFSQEKITVVHNPLEALPVGKKNVRKELHIATTERVLLYAGRITESKGVQNVLQAMQTIPKTVSVIIGKGEYEQTLKNQAAALGLAERVRFVGYVDNKELGQYYAAADIVIMAGTFYESLGRMLMEASAAGVPVIGTRRGGIPDVIEHGKTGFLLESQDGNELRTRIVEILDNKKLAVSMGKAGKAKMQKEFNAATVAKELVNVYNGVLEKYHDKK
jgi:glycosyltransferase involved in cell wall biosynthesis